MLERRGRATIESLGAALLAALATLVAGDAAGVALVRAVLVAIIIAMLAFCASLSVIVKGVETRLAECQRGYGFISDRLSLQRGMRHIEIESRQARAESTTDTALDAAISRFGERATTLLQVYRGNERHVRDVEAILAKSEPAGDRLDDLADLIATRLHDGDYL
jgi:hypothetical protein